MYTNPFGPQFPHQLANLNEWTQRIHKVNSDNGWHDDSRPPEVGVMLIASEAFEAFEELRKGRKPDEVYFTHDKNCPVAPEKLAPSDAECCNPKPEGFPTELADVFVRLMDEAERWGINLGYEVDRKVAYNATRGHKHGGKAF